MKKVFTFFLFLFVMGINAYAQTMVAVSSNQFTPADITIEVGETVQWDNMGGTHNVNGSTATFPSNPESFANGAASSMAWTFSHTFNTPGVYDYHCDPHQGLGMVGKVTVNMPVATNALVITGVYDAQPAGAGAKGLELYAVADIADLSTFGLGSANNGGGTDGEEFTFPAVSVSAGDFIYVSNDSTDFADFFGFNADYIDGSAAGINGDDAIELFENGAVIDVYGDINVDGNGTPWEYLDGWAYRNNGTGPDGSAFNVDNWTYSGVDALQDIPTNADAMNPFPIGSYSLSNLTNALVIAGVFDAQPGAAGTKGIELYALEDIADLSVFGLGAANNGGGSDSLEFNFPAVSMNAGTCFFVANDSTLFADFFGFNADFIEPGSGTAATGINGDDAIELFENGVVIDIFGDINVDGNGEVWEYLDGWAYRKSGTGPDGSTFNSDNWTYSGVDGLQGGATNADAPVPYVTCAYFFEPPAMLIATDDVATTDTNTVVTIDVLTNDALPNGFTSVNIDMMASNGMASINGDGTLNYLPTTDFCGTDMFTYIVCDATSACDTAEVTVNITCPTVYLQVPIADVTTVDPITGVADSIGRPFEITGIVYGVDLQGADDAIQFTIIDKFNSEAGIGLFSGGGATFGYTVNEGDEIVVQGSISQFRGLTQISPDTLWMVSMDNALHDPLVATALGESNESMLVKFENMKYVDIAEWAPAGAGFNVRITDGSTDTIAMRIDNDVDLFNMAAPDFGLFNVTGIGGQFTFNPENFDGYQLLPRYVQDIDEIVSVVDPTISENVSIAPNPVSETLFVAMTEKMDRLNITNILGQAVRTIENPDSLEEINVSNLPSGMYVLTFVNGDKIWSTQFIKE